MKTKTEMLYIVKWSSADDPETNSQEILMPAEIVKRIPWLTGCRQAMDDGMFSLDMHADLTRIEINIIL